MSISDSSIQMYDKVIQLLQSSHVPFTIHEHEVIQTVQDAMEKVPDWVAKLIKTVAFQIKDGDYVLAAVCGHSRIDYRKLAAVVGVNRRALRSLAPAEVSSQLGFEVGGVGPFPLRDDVQVLFDSRVMALGTIYCGTGRNTHTLEIHVTDLVEAICARVEDIVKD